jgi:uncharacterized membrane protein
MYMNKLWVVVSILLIVVFYALSWIYLGKGGRIFFGVILGLAIAFLISYLSYRSKD